MLRLSSLCFLWLAGAAFVGAANEPAAVPSASDASLVPIGTLRSGIQFAGETVDGDFSVLVPLHSNLGEGGRLGGSLIFAEPYAQWVEKGSVQAGIGLGFRHLFSSQTREALSGNASAGFMDEGIYIGANAFLDMAETRFDQRFWQLGLGAEIGTRYLELRGRYHLPLDNGEETQVRNHEEISGGSGWSAYGYRYRYTYQFTIDRVVDYLTEGLEGWDVEASVLVPGIDRWVDLRLIGGYASFHGKTLDAIDYDTWKVGVEFRPVPAVVLSGMWFENDRIVGDNWLFGISLEVPFETADIGDGKGGFWGHIKDAFKPRRRHLIERLSEPARRGSLPMQLGTGVTGGRTDVTFRDRGVLILPDGRVVVVGAASSRSSVGFAAPSGSGSAAAGSSGAGSSGSYAGATTRTVVMNALGAGSLSVSNSAIEVTSPGDVFGGIILNAPGAGTGSSSSTGSTSSSSSGDYTWWSSGASQLTLIGNSNSVGYFTGTTYYTYY